MDIGVCGCCLRRRHQLGIFFDGVDFGAEAREQRRGIAGRAADEQDAHPGVHRRGDEHAAGDERGIQRAAVRERDRAVHIGDAGERGGHMRLARHDGHRADHRGIDDVVRPELAVDHGGAHLRRRDFAKLCRHQPCSDSLRVKPLRGSSSRSGAVLQ